MDTEPDPDIVVSYTKHKDAALYFSHVIPIIYFQMKTGVIKAYEETKAAASVDQVLTSFVEELELPQGPSGATVLFPTHLQSDKVFQKLIGKVPVWLYLNELLGSLAPMLKMDSQKTQESVAKIGEALNVNLLDDSSLDISLDILYERYNLDKYPIVLPSDYVDLSSGVMPTLDKQDIRLSLIDMNLIDTASASWDQILDLRKDSDSHEKLQRLRRFMSTRYEGKSQSFIEDDLHQRIEDHESVVKRFGFEKKTMILDAFFNSKVLQTATAGSITASMLGEPVAAIASGAAGVIFEVGNTSVKLWKRQYEFNENVARHPLGYLINARERLE